MTVSWSLFQKPIRILPLQKVTILLICFRTKQSHTCSALINFYDNQLSFLDAVIHVSHHLSFDLSDTIDILHKMQKLVKKSNLLLITFAATDPAVNHTYCNLTVYLCMAAHCMWNLFCATFHTFEVTLNNILRRVWHLPHSCHTHILHLTAGLPSILNSVVSRCASLLASALSCSSAVVRTVFQSSSILAYTLLFGKDHIEYYYSHDGICASVIGHLRLHGSLNDSFINGMIYVISTS